MKKHLDPLGKMLLRAGVLDEQQLAQALERQQHPFSLASLCWALGQADELPLAQVLSKQRGVPAIVLERSIIRLTAIADIPAALALRGRVLPVREDEQRVFVAMEDPASAEALAEVQLRKGKAVVPHIVLEISLARAIRGCYAARERGAEYWYGQRALPSELNDPAGVMCVVSDVDELPLDLLDAAPRKSDRAIEDASQELAVDAL